MSVSPPDAARPGAQAPPPRPRRWLGLLVVVVLTCGGVAYAVEQREDDARSRPKVSVGPASPPNQSNKPPSKTAAAVAARRQAVDIVLLRRAKAVRDGNEKLFLADIDPADTKLRQEQRTLFANLVEIGFTEVGYSQARSGSTRPRSASTARRRTWSAS